MRSSGDALAAVYIQAGEAEERGRDRDLWPQIAARIPTGASVVIRTHHDEPGERYAQQIAASLHGRCRIRSRRRP